MLCLLVLAYIELMGRSIPLKKIKTGSVPYELQKDRMSSYKYLKVWGCLTKVAIPHYKIIKLEHKTIDYIFIGYIINISAYRFFVHKSEISDIHANTIIESKDVEFFESVFPDKRDTTEDIEKRKIMMLLKEIKNLNRVKEQMLLNPLVQTLYHL